MIKSIVRKSLLSKGDARLEERSLAPIIRKESGTSFYKLLEADPKGKVCVIRKLGGIGDVLMATPMLRQIKKDFPKCELTFAIDMHSTKSNIYYELIKNAPFLDFIKDHRYVDTHQYMAVVDISSVCIRHEHSGLPILNRIDIFSRAAGIPCLENKLPFYSVEEKEGFWADKFLRGIKNKKVILHTASMEGKRSWPLEKYDELIQLALLDKLNATFIILDFNNPEKRWNYKNCIDASNTSLREMAALISKADFFIGPDSGPMHIAGALEIQSLVLFGSIPPEARINYYPSHTAYRNNTLPCIGCWYKPCDKNLKCMTSIESRAIYKILKEKINA